MGGAEPARDGRHESPADRFLQHVVADAVELEEDDAGGRGSAVAVGPAAPPGREPVEPAPVGVVVPDGERAAGGGGDRGHHGGDDHGGLRRGLALSGGVDAQGEQQQRPVQEEDEQAEYECGHEEQGPHEQRPHQRRQQTEDARAGRRRDGDAGGAVPVVGLQLEVGQGAGQHQHRDRGHGPHRDAAPDPAEDPPPPSSTHVLSTSRPGLARSARPAPTLSHPPERPDGPAPPRTAPSADRSATAADAAGALSTRAVDGGRSRSPGACRRRR